MAEFKNSDELEAWLEGQPREVSVVIAARAALRVLPLLAVEFPQGKLKPRAVASDIVLPVFRASAVSWVAGRYPAVGPEIVNVAARTMLASHAAADAARFASNAADFAADIASAACAAADATLAAATAARNAAIATGATVTDASAAIAIATAAAAAANFTADAVRGILDTVFSSRVTNAADSDLWRSISADAARIENGMAPEKLAGEPLWDNEPPGWMINFQDELEQNLLGLDSYWRVWAHWYKARLRGEPTFSDASSERNEALEITRATIADEIWDKGPAAVNAEIRRLEKEILGEDWDAEPAQRPRSQSASTIGARLAEDPPQYAAEIGDLVSLFDAQIDWWESKKPNQDDEDWQGHYEFLKQIRTGFSHLTTQIEQLKTQLTPENQQSAGEQALVLQEMLVTWLKEFGETVSKSGKATALLSMIAGATHALVSITHANPTIALGIATAAIGGPTLTKAAGSLLGEKNKAADKPSEKDQD